MMHEIMTTAIEAANDAGKLLLASFKTDLIIDTKSDESLVTNLDKEAEELITSRIKSRFPTHSILAEEGTVGASGSDWMWVIDPLDGTHNYIRGIPLFGSMVAVLYKDEFVAGVINLPFEDALYSAEKGSGAFKNNQPIHVSIVSSLEHCSLSFDSSLKADPSGICSALKDLGSRVFNLRMFGSSAIVMTYLIDGRIDGAVEFGDKPWDLAAGVCLVREAGGLITTINGSPMKLEQSGYIAANPVLHDQLSAVVRQR